jgi:XTP/dITP diphosphohydrolase
MKSIIFATTNKGKFTSASRVLKRYDIEVIQSKIELPESQSSLETIATHKAQYAFNMLQRPVIAMDAGFFIDSLNGFPMMYVKPVLESIGIEGILKIAEGKERDCEFKEIVAYCDNTEHEPKLFTRIVRGTLSQKPTGTMDDKHWSELALIFIPEGESTTMADMDDAAYELFRHRVEANSHFEKFAQFYSKL